MNLDTARRRDTSGRETGDWVFDVEFAIHARASQRSDGRGLPPALACGLFLLVIVVTAVGGVLATDAGIEQAAAAEAGADLTRLLRLMALIKVAMAAAAAGTVLWRLGWPVSPVRLGIYALAGAATAAGPGLIWSMAMSGSAHFCCTRGSRRRSF